ncbi:hypothetical protein MANES_09G034600v8 [Manihot esculenta]|uniref:Uncharacterized protein n=1 Tax=Manihot esculenta TaxID=3983 RepID=A0ACB7H2F3_MANES|nr:hypothetical protein MANES_09G034600v8 [Manihot esculenta]
MMKPKTLLFLFCIMLLAVSSVAIGDVTWCPVEEKLQGGCEAIGGEFVCFVHFSRKYGLEMMPKNCKCSPSGSDQKLCTCDIIC